MRGIDHGHRPPQWEAARTRARLSSAGLQADTLELHSGYLDRSGGRLRRAARACLMDPLPGAHRSRLAELEAPS